MTKELRERFEEKFGYIFDTNDMSAKPINEKMLLWLEQEILEAERRGESRGVKKGSEDMKERCMNVIALYYPYEAQVEAINKL